MESAEDVVAESPLPEPRRSALVGELDVVIDEHLDRVRSEIAELKSLATRILEDWRTLSASLELRAKFASGSLHPADEEFATMDLPRDLFRWLSDTRESRHGMRKRSGQPRGRIEEILELLQAAGRPLTSDEIVTAMEERNLLDGVNDPRATVSAALSRGTRLGFLERLSRGVYAAGQDRRDG